ncbi:MAG: hypothetical protein AAF730_12860 [Bacteroidota bacterium]
MPTLVRRLLVFAVFLSPALSFAQSSPASPEVTAVFVEDAPRIDGHLDDAAWQRIEPLTEFIQVWPEDGDAATERSEVKIAYDRDYLYFAFKFFDQNPELIRAKNLERGGRNDRAPGSWRGSAPGSGQKT